jgi:hypothetical protein
MMAVPGKMKAKGYGWMMRTPGRYGIYLFLFL